MSDVCPKCSKELSCRYSLVRHLNKSLPCDLKCKLCDFKALNKNSYYYHKKTRHGEKKVAEIVPVIKGTIIPNTVPVIERDPSLKIRLPRPTDYSPVGNIIPMQDFDRDYIDHYITMAREQNVKIVVEVRYTFTPLQEQRAEKAISSLNMSDYATSLSCLDTNVNKIAASLLDNLHGDKSRPELQSIRLGDMSRKNVNILSRIPGPNEGIKWMPYAKEKALEVLSKHISSVLELALVRATDLLDYKFCVDKKCVCYCLHDSVEQRYVIIRDGDETDGLGEPQLLVEIYVGEMIDCPREFRQKLYNLQDLISTKGAEVTEQIKNLQFTEEDIMSFLERSRRPF